MTEEIPDQAARDYAASVLNRAEIAFDVADINMIAQVLTVIEGDIADWFVRVSSFVPADLKENAGQLILVLEDLAYSMRAALWRRPTAAEGEAQP